MLQAASLSKLAGIRHGFFTRSGGGSQGVYASLNGGLGSNDAPDNVAENRARMAAALGVPVGHLLTAYQIHSPDVAVVDKPWTKENRPRADAIVTRTPRLAIGVSTADCGPLLFADPQACVIGAMEKLGADRARIAAVLGPTISQPNYEVGPEFVDRFLAAAADNTRFFRPSERAGHAMFDLAGYIAARVRGAKIANFEDLGLCTFAEPDRFFSYRRTTKLGEPDYGRHINAIALAD